MGRTKELCRYDFGPEAVAHTGIVRRIQELLGTAFNGPRVATLFVTGLNGAGPSRQMQKQQISQMFKQKIVNCTVQAESYEVFDKDTTQTHWRWSRGRIPGDMELRLYCRNQHNTMCAAEVLSFLAFDIEQAYRMELGSLQVGYTRSTNFSRDPMVGVNNNLASELGGYWKEPSNSIRRRRSPQRYTPY